jgi:NhaP-type Na+/H+ or K+/H+ antiporter
MRVLLIFGILLGFALGYLTASLVSFQLQASSYPTEYLLFIGVIVIVVIFVLYALSVSIFWRKESRRGGYS